MATSLPITQNAIKVFFSYAHVDEGLRNELAKHLSLLERQGIIAGWHDRRIAAGTQWVDEIDTRLQTAHVILLLVSADFLASNYCYDIEVQQAMARHESGDARVIPIILRPVDTWQAAPFGKLLALPRDGRPVTSWPNVDEAFADVARGIRKVALELSENPRIIQDEFMVDGTRVLRPELRAMPKAWNPPRTPDPFIGREKDLNRVKAALGILPEVSGVRSKIISIHGVPGVGKSTFTAWLANDSDILRSFPDAVLWSPLGQFHSSSESDFEIRERLKSWGALLGDEHLYPSMRISEMTDRLAIMLRNRRALLICDDVWDVDHISAIRRLADGDVRLLITSRLTDIAARVVSHPDGVMELKVFAESDAISLLEIVAPAVVAQYPDKARALVRDLEYLPLAINVTGHLLRREMNAGLDVVALIEELREEGERILKEAPPVDIMELVREAKSPTVAAWLKRSTQMLDADTRRCFISLGFLAPKPATFGLDVLRWRWTDQDVNAVIRNLIDTGLIQATSDGRYQMHALLVTLARSMGKETSNE